jgi:hypothetical protein
MMPDQLLAFKAQEQSLAPKRARVTIARKMAAIT